MNFIVKDRNNFEFAKATEENFPSRRVISSKYSDQYVANISFSGKQVGR